DRPMEGDPPRLRQKFRGEWIERQLTRRQFLCFLFGYLAFLTLLISIGAIAVNIVRPSLISLIVAKHWAVYLKFGSLFLFLFVFWNLVTTTLVGLFYLTDRMHRPSSTWSPPGIDGANPMSGEGP